MSNLPDYHCPDCDDWDCLHCFCVEGTDCQSCRDFIKEEQKKENKMSNNSNKTDTHIYNIINNPPKEFTEPCFACGVSEFQLGIRHERKRILDGLASQHEELRRLRIMAKKEGIDQKIELMEARIIDLEHFIAFVNEEPSIYDFVPEDEGEQK